jgi:L-alanine-DL-glutamate epimerase-like enolase superfamily enzyme
MRKVREKTGVTVVADESLCSPADARSLVSARAADVFNIRIGKCGGFFASHDLVRIARDTGLSCQLGTLVGETGILSRAAEIFGERVRGFEFLEGKGQNRHLLLEDVVEAAPSQSTNAHGLGVTISPKNITRWADSPEVILEGAQGVGT